MRGAKPALLAGLLMLQDIENQLDYIAGMGFTSLWLTPVLEPRSALLLELEK